MRTGIRYSYFFIYMMVVAAGIFSANDASAQRNLKGRVIYKADARPAARASVSMLRKHNISMTDEAGNFSIPVMGNDTLLISSVGYESIRISGDEALRQTEFALIEKTRNLSPVTVKFNSTDVLGATKENVGYFRSWNYDRTGGEMGRIFNLSYKAFTVDKVRFKVSNMCNACLLRLHIRKVVDGRPAEELVRDSISVIVKGMKIDDKAQEFDLSKYEFVFHENDIFVGIEVISCDHPEKSECSFLFAGTEAGSYTFKSKANSDWETTDASSMYIKLFLRY